MGNFTFTSSSIASHSTAAASSTVVGCLWYYQGLFRFSCSSTLVRVLCLPCLPQKGRQQRTTHSNDSNDDLYYVCVRRYLSKSPSLPLPHFLPPTDNTNHQTRKGHEIQKCREVLWYTSSPPPTHQHPKRSGGKTSYVGTNVH